MSDHAFESYPSGNEALVDVCQVCGDYHDERREPEDVKRAHAEKLRERVEAKLLARDVRDVVADVPRPFMDSAAGIEDDYDPEAPGRDVVERTNVEIDAGVTWETLRDFKLAARALKAAETAYREAQQAYAEAVKRLSEEAVK